MAAARKRKKRVYKAKKTFCGAAARKRAYKRKKSIIEKILSF